MPETTVAMIQILPDGSVYALPAGAMRDAAVTRVVITGAVQCSYNGRSYDAFYVCASDGTAITTQPHRLLRWTGTITRLLEADSNAHRYVFGIAPSTSGQAASGVGIALDRLVDELLISPSEVKRALSGSLRAELVQTVPPPATSWLGLGVGAVAFGLSVSSVGWVVRRRLLFDGLDADLKARLAAINGKVQSAQLFVDCKSASSLRAAARLAALRQGAAMLAQYIQRLRRARIEQGHTTTFVAGDPLCEAEQAAVRRLERLETTAGAALETLQHLNAVAAPFEQIERLASALDSEIAAMREVGGNL